MFIELTEILQDNLYSNKEPERLTSINPAKIQAFFSDGSATVVQFRRENVKVQEDYETVKALIAISEKSQSNTKRRDSR